MALQLRETTIEQFPGLSRRYPIRLVDPSIKQMQPGKRYKVRVCMFAGNPAFDCILECTGQFEGYLLQDGGTFVQADEALYLHVLEEVGPKKICEEPTERLIEYCSLCRVPLNPDGTGHERGCSEGSP